MENEKRLIEADAFLQWLVKRFKCVPLVGSCDNDSESMKLLLAQAPTVDAVEVVRCEDCKFFEADFSDDGVAFGRCVVDYPDIEFVERLGYDFCSYGERRTDG